MNPQRMLLPPLPYSDGQLRGSSGSFGSISGRSRRTVRVAIVLPPDNVSLFGQRLIPAHRPGDDRFT